MLINPLRTCRKEVKLSSCSDSVPSGNVFSFFVPADVVLLYLVYNLCYTAASYGAGKLSDQVGRKPLLLSAMIAPKAKGVAEALSSKGFRPTWSESLPAP